MLVAFAACSTGGVVSLVSVGCFVTQPDVPIGKPVGVHRLAAVEAAQSAPAVPAVVGSRLADADRLAVGTDRPGQALYRSPGGGPPRAHGRSMRDGCDSSVL